MHFMTVLMTYRLPGGLDLKKKKTVLGLLTAKNNNERWASSYKVSMQMSVFVLFLLQCSPDGISQLNTVFV